MRRNFLILSSLLSLCSCIFLSRSSIINHNPEEEVISVFSLEIIYDGKVEKKHSGLSGFCQLRFHDDEIEPIKFRREGDSKFYILKSQSGKTMADSLNCAHYVIPLFYLKHRRVDLTYWAFWAHPGYVNYLGHIVINYKPSDFGTRDLFALGGLKYDTGGKLDVRVEDRVEEASAFLRRNYPELKNIPLAKSFFDDVLNIKPDKKPEAYDPNAAPTIPASNNQPKTTDTQTKIQPASTNPYYTPYQPTSSSSYYNPYEHKDSISAQPLKLAQ